MTHGVRGIQSPQKRHTESPLSTTRWGFSFSAPEKLKFCFLLTEENVRGKECLARFPDEWLQVRRDRIDPRDPMHVPDNSDVLGIQLAEDYRRDCRHSHVPTGLGAQSLALSLRIRR